MSTVSVPGYVCAFRFAADGRGTLIADDAAAAASADGEAWIWLHLNLADWRCRRWLGETFGLPRDLVAEFADTPTRQHVSAWESVLFGHLADFRREFDGNSTDHAWLHFVLGNRYLITGRVKAVQSAEWMRGQIAGGQTFSGPDAVLSRLLERYTDTLDGALHRLNDELELIEDHVLDDRHRGERRRLMLARRETAQFHRHMRALRRALQNAERASIPTPRGFTPTAARLDALEQDFSDIENRARFFHDEIDAKLAAETNRQLYVLSVLTAAFLPPTLVAGLFGMNVPGIPFGDSHLGFVAAVGVSVISSGAVMLYLRMMDRG